MIAVDEVPSRPDSAASYCASIRLATFCPKKNAMERDVGELKINLTSSVRFEPSTSAAVQGRLSLASSSESQLPHGTGHGNWRFFVGRPRAGVGWAEAGGRTAELRCGCASLTGAGKPLAKDAENATFSAPIRINCRRDAERFDPPFADARISCPGAESEELDRGTRSRDSRQPFLKEKEIAIFFQVNERTIRPHWHAACLSLKRQLGDQMPSTSPTE